MTQEELDALPEQETGFGLLIRDDGARVPVAPSLRALFIDEDDGSVRDQNGDWWLVGWDGGVRVKRRMRP